MTSLFPAYQGSGPYVFVSYAHIDSVRIQHELAFLRDAGINVWYDEGITPGSRWSDELANAIDSASLVLVFLTDAAVQSENCLNEMDFALRKRRPFLAVELEPVTLPPGIELSIGNRQSILSHQLDEADYRARLLEAIRRIQEGEQPRHGSMGLAHAPFPETKDRRPSFLALLAGLGMAAMLAVVGYLLFQKMEPADQLTQTSVEMDTVAVLPFENLSDDPEFDYLADGLAAELITTLGSIQALTVSSRTSSFFYRDQTPQMQDIRARLGVGHAIEGSLRPAPDGLSINVSLFETSRGLQVWSRQFNVGTQQVSELSTQITLEIVRVLKPELDLSEIPKPMSDGNTTSDAYEDYLKGLDFLARPPSQESLDAAILFFESALTSDPNLARAAAGLCEAHLAYYRMAKTDDIEARFEAATSQCAAALQLDSTLWSGHQALAALYRLSGRYEEALREIRLADTLQPNSASIQYEYGKILGDLGNVTQAEEKFRRGIELDPGFWGGYADLGDHLYLLGRYEEALTMFHKALALSPDNDLMLVSLGASYYMLDKPEDANRSWRQAIQKNPDATSRAFWQSATWLGINSLNQSCPEEAAFWQQKAINVSPADHRLWGRLAESCQMQQSDPAQPAELATEIYQHAITLAAAELAVNPNDWESLGLITLYRSRLSTDNPSSELIERMLELQPGNPDALEIALLFFAQQDSEHKYTELRNHLLLLNFPPDILANNPYLVGKRSCESATDEKERLICAQGTIIPALRN